MKDGYEAEDVEAASQKNTRHILLIDFNKPGVYNLFGNLVKKSNFLGALPRSGFSFFLSVIHGISIAFFCETVIFLYPCSLSFTKRFCTNY